MNKEKWVIHLDGNQDVNEKDKSCWSITTNPDYPGWNTDSAYYGYGLPKELAQWICDQLNRSQEICPYEIRYHFWEKKK